MRQKTKITITAMVVMLLMALAVTVISFSFADEPNNNGSQNVAASESLTNVDYIIKNSNDETLTDENRKYHIVEIGSGKQSSLGNYSKNSSFEEYVLNGNKSASFNEVFSNGKVDYHYFNAKDINSESKTNGGDETDFSIIAKADMIYISNGKDGYRIGNDISEELLSLIQPMAVGKYIPIIIDMPGKSGSLTPGEDNRDSRLGALAGEYFANEGKYYYTFGYDNAWSVTDFFDTSLASKSLYLSINSKTQFENGRYAKVQDGDNIAYMGKMLVISASGNVYGGSAPMTDKLTAGFTSKSGLVYPAEAEGATTTPVTGAVYDITGTTLEANAYNARYNSTNPKYIMIEEAAASDLSSVNLEDYDMVFIEKDAKTVALSDADYDKLVAAMYGRIHISYDKDIVIPKSANGQGDNTESFGTNYQKLYDMVARNDIPANANIMPTDKSKIDAITGSSSAAGAKPIADLINASSYRGIGGPKSTSSKFAVLEIQPCYPVDEDIVAAQSNSYYVDPDAVINGLTKEEIIEQRKKSGMSDAAAQKGFEYYAWELSKAKIADALDMDANDIVLTQMSTEEFSSYKKEMLGSYDLIYIGGNTSAIKKLDKFYGYIKATNGYNTGNFAAGVCTTEGLKKQPIYRMYSHNGDLVTYDLSHFKSAGLREAAGDKPINKTLNGAVESSAMSASVLNGNDISSINYNFLKDYVDAGMPIVISKDVTDAYKYIADHNTSDEKYYQNSIDPDSNMCKFLNYCNDLRPYNTSGSNNIIWGFKASGDDVTELADSDNGRLSTLANKVRVFNATQRTTLKDLYTTSTKRPKLVVTSSPTIYNMFDESSISTSTDLKFKVQKAPLGLEKVDFKLYIDDNGNSLFDDGEAPISAKVVGSEYVLTAKLAKDFFGPVYWKLEVGKNVSGSPKSSITGLTYIRPSNSPHQDVCVLQILPGSRKVSKNAEVKFKGPYGDVTVLAEGGDEGGANGLYFCTECMMGYKNLYFNPATDVPYGEQQYYYGKNHYSDNNVSTSGYCGSLDMGLHEHKFGIVSYDSELPLWTPVNVAGGKKITTGRDDWQYNLADDLKKYYNFDVDIMYVDDFERYSREISDMYKGLYQEDIEKLQKYFSEKSAEYKIKYDAQVRLVEAKEDELDEVIDEMIANIGSVTGWQAALNTTDKRIKALEHIKKDKSYYDLFSYGNNTGVGYDLSSSIYGRDVYKSLYKEWVELHNMELILKGGYYVTPYTYKYYKKLDQSQSDDLLYGLVNGAKAAAQGKNTAYLDDAGSKNCVRIFGYQDYKKFAGGPHWMKEYYTTVAIGPSEQFAGDDITDDSALQCLETYIRDEGQLIMFHDTLSAFEDRGTVKLTALLRNYAGADRYHQTVDTAKISGTYPHYVPYKTTSNITYPSSIYFNTNLSYKSGDERYATWNQDMAGTIKSGSEWITSQQGYFINPSFTDSALAVIDGSNKNNDMYEYAEIAWDKACFWSTSSTFLQKGAQSTYATDKATKNNDAIVTMFPYQLADEIFIGGTHPQVYAIDTDYKNLTVLYSLAAGTTPHDNTSIFAADPGDGTDNYFIYACDNIYYCGAGHGKIVGMTKDNQNERYLYLNIICNAVRRSAFEPKIEVFDPEPHATKDELENKLTNTVIKEDGVNYIYRIDEDTLYPEFKFRIGADEKAEISKVEIYYDLDFYDHLIPDPDKPLNDDGSENLIEKAAEDGFNEDTDIMIAIWGAETDKTKSATSVDKVYKKDTVDIILGDDLDYLKTYSDAGTNTTRLKLHTDYFMPYGGKYTYIVIKVTDTNGAIRYQRIKVTYKDKLFNLT